jgi:cytochrome P450
MMIQNGQKKDILDILLEDKGEHSEDGDIIDLLLALLFAGHESTALLMMWSIRYLTNNPLCLKKARVNITYNLSLLIYWEFKNK